MASTSTIQDDHDTVQECFKCKIQENLRKENITAEKTVIICKECYECNKCSVCCELFEGDSVKLHDDVECCKVQLCTRCRDYLRDTNITTCPVCKHDPSPPQQEEPQQQLIQYLSDEYNYINQRSNDWILQFTQRDPNSFVFKNDNIEIPLQYFLEDQIIYFENSFYSYQFNYTISQNLLLMRIYYYCPLCPRVHYKQYTLHNRSNIDDIIEAPHIDIGGAAEEEE